MYNDGPSVIVAQWVLFGLACGAVLIRIGAARRHEYGFWWDDLVSVVALIVFLATCVTGTLALAWGCGKYVADVDPSMLPKATLMGIIATDLGMLADAVPKIAVALLIIRLFHPAPWAKWTMFSGTILCLLFNVLLIIFSIVQCTPHKYQWNRGTMEGKCWNIDIYTDFAYFTGAWTAALDLFFSLYPLFVISQLRMAWRKKLAVMATMSFGFGTFAVTCYKVITQYPKFHDGPTEATRILANIMLWNVMGAGFTIIAGSIPTWGWMFRTKKWSMFICWISKGKFAPSRRVSEQMEKRPPPAQSIRPTPDILTQSTPPFTGTSSLDEVRLDFPETAHLYESYGRPRSRQYSLSRGTLPLDSIMQLERATWS